MSPGSFLIFQPLEPSCVLCLVVASFLCLLFNSFIFVLGYFVPRIFLNLRASIFLHTDRLRGMVARAIFTLATTRLWCGGLTSQFGSGIHLNSFPVLFFVFCLGHER